MVVLGCSQVLDIPGSIDWCKQIAELAYSYNKDSWWAYLQLKGSIPGSIPSGVIKHGKLGTGNSLQVHSWEHHQTK